MAIRINNIIIDLDENTEVLKSRCAHKLKIPEKDIKEFRILKESIDARRKDKIKLNYSVEIECDKETRIVTKIRDKDVALEEPKTIKQIIPGTEKLNERPVIIGMGPAGMFAGLLLAKNGYRPLIIERGQNVDERTESVYEFWKSGSLNTESNVQFGEGGAGTFSDGKLTTRIKDKRCDFVLEEFVKAGAPGEIIYSGKPHVGTDILKSVVKNIRKKIIELGGEVRFNSKLEDIIVTNKSVSNIIVNGEEIPCSVVILALGHSSRDTFEMIFKKRIEISPKAFAIGVRIEHPRQMIDENQYGRFAGHPKLKAADYRLAYRSEKTGRSVYSFCMCPGGVVVGASSEDCRLVTNGMSYHSREDVNSNSAIVVSVSPEDFNGSTPLKGMEFQRHYERLAYELGGGGYTAPIQLLGDFMRDKTSSRLGSIIPSYKPGWEFRDLSKCLPHYVIETLKDGLVNFDKKIKGFACDDAVLTGIETRTSSPIRIERNDNLESVSFGGIYPAGEGAGFAGGIISAAVDGLRVAESIIKKYAPM